MVQVTCWYFFTSSHQSLPFTTFVFLFLFYIHTYFFWTIWELVILIMPLCHLILQHLFLKNTHIFLKQQFNFKLKKFNIDKLLFNWSTVHIPVLSVISWKRWIYTRIKFCFKLCSCQPLCSWPFSVSLFLSPCHCFNSFEM